MIVLSAELSTLINNSVDKEFTAVVSKIDGFVFDATEIQFCELFLLIAANFQFVEKYKCFLDSNEEKKFTTD